jgi:cytochrome c-type biogenesis protein CcmH/NrfG
MRETNVKHIQEIERLKYSGLYGDAKVKVQGYLLKHADDYRLYEELADIGLYEGDLDAAEAALKIAQRLHPESATGMYLM